MNGCIFCAIINGELPSYKLYEDGLYIAIFDRYPVCVGHTLLIPKIHSKDLFDLPRNYAEALMPLAQKTAAAINKAFGCDGLNLLQNNGDAAGQAVGHFHLHLIPRYVGDAGLFTYKKRDDLGSNEFEAALNKIIKFLK